MAAWASWTVWNAISNGISLIRKAFVLVLVAGGFVTVFLALMGGLTILSMISKRNRTFLTEHTITLAEDNFTSESAYAKTEWKWPSVQKIARTNNYCFVYVAQHAAIVVPRRAFADHEQWSYFNDYCRERMRRSS